MPPPRSRPQPDDSRSEASSTKDKINTSTGAAINGKGRRVANSAATGSSLRDVVTAGPSGTTAGGSGGANSESSTGVSFPSAQPPPRRPQALTIPYDHRSNGRRSMPQSCTDIDTTTVSTHPLPSINPITNSCFRARLSAGCHLRWHDARNSGDRERTSWRMQFGSTSTAWALRRMMSWLISCIRSAGKVGYRSSFPCFLQRLRCSG